MSLSVKSPFDKKQEAPAFLEPTKELVQDLFGRADITIEFTDDYEGIPKDFSISEEEKQILHPVRYIHIKDRPPFKFAEGTILDLETDRGGTLIEFESVSKDTPEGAAVYNAAFHALSNICRRLRLYSVGRGSISESEFSSNKGEKPRDL